MTGKIDDYKTRLVTAEAEIARLKQTHTTQDLTFRVIQERLVFTTNEAEKYKKLAQDKIIKLSAFSMRMVIILLNGEIFLPSHPGGEGGENAWLGHSKVV